MENHSSRFRRKKFMMFPLFGTGFVLLGGWLVMLLWNAILPVVVPPVQPLNYWQAVGLLLLCRLLCGGVPKAMERTIQGRTAMAAKDDEYVG